MQGYLKLIIIIPVLVSIFSCVNQPESTEQRVELTVKNISTDFAVLAVQLEPLVESQIRIERTEAFISSHFISEPDSLIYIENLTPSSNYLATISFTKADGATFSKSVDFRTLDSSTYDKSWERIILSDYQIIAQSIYSTAIISEDEIILSGSFVEIDSIGGMRFHNFLKGKVGELIGFDLLFKSSIFDAEGNISAKDILAFDDEIWLLDGIPMLYANNELKSYELKDIVHHKYSEGFLLAPDQSLRKLWGTSSKNLYAAGQKGALVHFDGNVWSKIELGTVENITGLWGYVDESSGKTIVYCSTGKNELPIVNDVFKIEENVLVSKVSYPVDSFVYSIWGMNGYQYFYIGGDIRRIRQNSSKIIEINQNAALKYIDGLSDNNIFVLGGTGIISHYNGVRWQNDYQFQSRSINFLDLSVGHNKALIVAREGSGSPYLLKKTIF